jgi:hypothetical protein
MRKLILLLAVSLPLAASDFTKLEIRVTNEFGRPIDRAAVTVRFKQGRHKIKMTKIQRSWDLRTTQEGVAKIPAIPKGEITIFVTAKNHQTFGQTLEIEEDEKLIEVVLKPPQPQYSVHTQK